MRERQSDRDRDRKRKRQRDWERVKRILLSVGIDDIMMMKRRMQKKKSTKNTRHTHLTGQQSLHKMMTLGPVVVSALKHHHHWPRKRNRYLKISRVFIGFLLHHGKAKSICYLFLLSFTVFITLRPQSVNSLT